jgi:glycosyltransferase involved in cell wall biosynthesis
MQPLVSILIPAYNAQATIADTIASARRQTWARKEIILVDDGSTDQTPSIVRGFPTDFMTVFTQKNLGAAAARNQALAMSKGDYIQWLDADDLLAPDKIEAQLKLVDYASGSRSLLSSAWGSFNYRVSRAKFSPTPLWCNLTPVQWLLYKMRHNLYMMPASWLISRELTTAAGLWDTRLSLDDDGEYFCRILMASDGVRFSPEARSYYRHSSFSSLSHVDHSDKKLESLFLSLLLHMKYLLALENSHRTRSACAKYLQRWMIHFYPARLDLVRELETMGASLGRRLERPDLRWKYIWLQRSFGWEFAKQAQFFLPKVKHTLLRSWDRAHHKLESRSPTKDRA